MNLPSLKLKFKTSKNTNLNASLIKTRITKKLENKKYVILESANNSIKFGSRTFELVWNFQAPFLLDGGNFQINEMEEETLVTLDYFIDTLYSLLVIAAIIVVIIIQGEYSAILFFGLFYLIAAVFQYFTTKNVGKNLLDDILGEND